MGPVRALLADLDVTEQQWRVLRVLNETGPAEPTQIAEQACLLLPSLTRILQKLEEKQLITREKDQADRRRQIVSIAPMGARLIEDNLDAALELVRQTRDRMGPDRYDALLDLLNALIETPSHPE